MPWYMPLSFGTVAFRDRTLVLMSLTVTTGKGHLDMASKTVEEPASEKAVLTCEEVARMCGLNRMTVFNLAWSGALPSFKVGRRRLIRREALMQWMAQREDLEMAARRSA